MSKQRNRTHRAWRLVERLIVVGITLLCGVWIGVKTGQGDAYYFRLPGVLEGCREAARQVSVDLAADITWDVERVCRSACIDGTSYHLGR